MTRFTNLILTKILYFLFIIATLITIFIVFKDINSNVGFKFVIGYLFFTFFMLLYIPFVTILNSRKLKWVEVRKRLYKFLGLLIFFVAINFAYDFVFRPSNINVFRGFSTALGIAFGISFLDVTFLKKKED